MKLALAMPATTSVISKRIDMMRAGQWSQVYKELPTRLCIRPVCRTRRAKSLIEDNAISNAVEALNAPLECEGPTVSDADIVTLRGLHPPSADASPPQRHPQPLPIHDFARRFEPMSALRAALEAKWQSTSPIDTTATFSAPDATSCAPSEAADAAPPQALTAYGVTFSPPCAVPYAARICACSRPCPDRSRWQHHPNGIDIVCNSQRYWWRHPPHRSRDNAATRDW